MSLGGVQGLGRKVDRGQIVIEQCNQAASHDIAGGLVPHTAAVERGAEEIFDGVDIVAMESRGNLLGVIAVGHIGDFSAGVLPGLIQFCQDILQLL